MTKKGNKKVTLSVDSRIYDSFKKYCEENAIMLSKKVEIWMSEELRKSSRTPEAKLQSKKRARKTKGGTR